MQYTCTWTGWLVVTDEVSYRVVTVYGGHPMLGTWESASRRSMTLEQAGEFVTRKSRFIANRKVPSGCGVFLGMRIEAMTGRAWEGYGPDPRKVLTL